MLSIYRAYDPKLRRDVAVKIIHPHLSENPKFASRFEGEAAAMDQPAPPAFTPQPVDNTPIPLPAGTFTRLDGQSVSLADHLSQ
jgi:hypothetical protein